MAFKTYAAVLVLLLGVGALPVEAQKFYTDDPYLVDDDELDIADQPAELELSDMYDRFGHMFNHLGVSPMGSEAQNVNTLDEVSDSGWFVNRHGRQRMSLEQLVSGPNRGSGPDPNETWTVFRSKTQGLTPGFQILDEKGDRYVIKLDPVEVPELASAAEVIATKLFYAIGYNVPENYIVRVHPDQFVIREGTQTEDSFGDKMALTPWRFDRSIRRVPRLEDGTIRVTASKYLPGVPIGPFRYYETRTDDPNDVIPHEDLRELRGLRLLAAWTNHDDTRAQNTQDAWVDVQGRHTIRHYLMDFGSTFGSGSVAMQGAHLSYQYSMDFAEMKRNLLGFGFRVPPYRRAQWPSFPEYQAVGRWESEVFDPERWRNDYPNPAFQRMTARDGFWAAKILMKFTAEELRAIVATGEYSNSDNADYFLAVLIERQRKSGRFGINAINPIDEFRLAGGLLEFTNLSEKYGFVEAETRYQTSWSSYDNIADSYHPLSAAADVGARSHLEIPDGVDAGLFLVAEISSINAEHSQWNTAVRVYLRPVPSGYDIVGIDRDSPEKSTFPMN
jgi:hypothetical protein